MEQELCMICIKLDSFKDYDVGKWKNYIENEEDSVELLKHLLLQNLHKSGQEKFTETLIWLINTKDALEQITCSGPVENGRWKEAVEMLGQIIEKNESPPSGHGLKLAIATALTFSSPVTSLAHQYLALEDPEKTVFISGVERWKAFRDWEEQGQLFPEFKDLSTWHMRYVVGSWATDPELSWARENVLPKFRHAEKVGEATQEMVKYTPENEKGVSVYKPWKFYEGRPLTMEVLHEFGAVCGGVSKFGCAMSQSFGLPAMPFTQPAHCAFIWLKKGRFELSNDNSGWLKSGKHDGIQNTWGGEQEKRGGVWMLPIMEKAQQDFENFCISEKFRIASGLIGEDEGEKACALLQEATKTCWANVWAWKERVDMEIKTRNKKDWMLAAGKWLHGNRSRVLSYGKKVEVSDGAESAENIVDGTGSEWMSGEKSAWIKIDLGEECVIEGVKIEWWIASIKSKYSLYAALSKGDFVLQRNKSDEIKSDKGWSEVMGWPETTKTLRLELEDGQMDPWNLGKYHGIRQILVMGYPIRKRETLPIKMHRVDGLAISTDGYWCSDEEKAWIEFNLDSVSSVEAVRVRGKRGSYRVSTDLSLEEGTDWRGSGPESWKPFAKEFTEVALDAVANKLRVEVLCDANEEEMMKLEELEVVGVARGWRELMKACVEMEMGGEEASLVKKGDAEKAALVRYVHGLVDRESGMEESEEYDYL